MRNMIEDLKTKAEVEKTHALTNAAYARLEKKAKGQVILSKDSTGEKSFIAKHSSESAYQGTQPKQETSWMVPVRRKGAKAEVNSFSVGDRQHPSTTRLLGAPSRLAHSSLILSSSCLICPLMMYMYGFLTYSYFPLPSFLQSRTCKICLAISCKDCYVV